MISVAARPHPAETMSGDAWSVSWHEARCRIAVIDGLGHGPEAAAAAQSAVRTLEQQPTLGPHDALLACHDALRGSRGAAISIVAIDSGTRRLTYAGIGNVEGRLGGGHKEQRLIAYRGIVGSVMRQVRSFEHTLADDWWLVLNTDGVSSRLEIPVPGEQASGTQQAMANQLLEQWGRETDDATLVLVSPNDVKECS